MMCIKLTKGCDMSTIWTEIPADASEYTEQAPNTGSWSEQPVDAPTWTIQPTNE